MKKKVIYKLEGIVWHVAPRSGLIVGHARKREAVNEVASKAEGNTGSCEPGGSGSFGVGVCAAYNLGSGYKGKWSGDHYRKNILASFSPSCFAYKFRLARDRGFPLFLTTEKWLKILNRVYD